MSYINRDELLTKIEEVQNECRMDGTKEELDLLDDFHTYVEFDITGADVQPVRHGEWLYVDEYDDMRRCSECNHEVKAENISRYCPHCGAKMEDDAE